jgi:hypothetical protein
MACGCHSSGNLRFRLSPWRAKIAEKLGESSRTVVFYRAGHIASISYGRVPNPLLKLLAPGQNYCPRRVLKIGIGLAKTLYD